jgi:2-methylcitrate dehydratase PrpD
VTVRLRDGRSASAAQGKPLGSPANPISIEQLRMKFFDCAHNAVRPLPDHMLQESADAILRLEGVPDVSTLLQPFA